MSEMDRIDKTVDYLTYKLDTKPQSIPFLYWAASRLPDTILMRLVATAKERAQNPGAYFNRLVKAEVRKRG